MRSEHRRRGSTLRWLCACLLGLVATVGIAAPAAAQGAAPRPAAANAGGPAWSSLSPAQQQALAPLERDWPQIDAPRKSKWLEVAARFPGMPAEERARIQQRMTEWARLSPAERGRARLVFQEAKQLSPEERQARWEAYRALPDDRRQALAARGKPAEERGARAASQVAAPLEAAVPKAAATAPARASGPRVKPVAPTVVQARPGATTRLMTTPAPPPPHQQPGKPKIAARPGEVDSQTLLPRRGPQAAGAAASSPARQP